jgi:hypothetical protein
LKQFNLLSFVRVLKELVIDNATSLSDFKSYLNGTEVNSVITPIKFKNHTYTSVFIYLCEEYGLQAQKEYFRLQEKGSEVFIDSLIDKFQDRIKYFNENSNKTKNYTPLPVKKRVIPKMSKVLKVKGRIDVINAFVAFADDILEG